MNVQQIVELLERRGDSQYGGESVSQLEHALQCAKLAEDENASTELISAALLHDLGHMLHDLPEDAPDHGVDDRHEITAARHLAALFPPAVTEPIRMHVDAKRYLCSVDRDYLNALSSPSIQSLELQGGPFDAEEATSFEANPYAEDAVRLRRWDDLAKVAGLETPPLKHYEPHLRAAAESADL